jgi:hypothetical protein
MNLCSLKLIPQTVVFLSKITAGIDWHIAFSLGNFSVSSALRATLSTDDFLYLFCGLGAEERVFYSSVFAYLEEMRTSCLNGHRTQRGVPPILLTGVFEVVGYRVPLPHVLLFGSNLPGFRNSAMRTSSGVRFILLPENTDSRFLRNIGKFLPGTPCRIPDGCDFRKPTTTINLSFFVVTADIA